MSHRKTWMILAASLAGASLACAPKAETVTQTQNARQAVEQGALLLDVRTPEEFADGHLDGAVNIPVQSLEERAAELPAKDRQLVVYCRSGARSARATSWLKAQGYQNVIDLGAMSNWPDAK